MSNKLIEETQQSYYEYVLKIQDGCKRIANYLQKGDLELAFQNISYLSEGLEWLYTVEQYMSSFQFQIHSQISEAIELIQKINQALEERDFNTISNLFENEMSAIFSSASEWIFEQVQN